MLKVIHVAHSAEKYGIGTFLINLVKCQITDSKNSIAVVFNSSGPKLNDYMELDIPVYNLKLPSAKDIRGLRRYYKIFRDYDIINLHTYSPWAFIAARLAKKKIIYTFHGSLDLRYVMGIPVTKLYVKHLMLKKCDYLTFASETSLNHFKTGYGVKDINRFDIFSYGLNLNDITVKQKKSEVKKNLKLGDKFIIGTSMRLVPVKRPDLLIEAFSGLSNIDDYMLLILGDGNSKYTDYVKKIIKEHGLSGNVRLLGYRQDVLEIINICDVFVLPSRREPFGLSLLEAMSLGIPSIVFSDGGATVNILQDSGFVVHDVAEFRDVVHILKNDKSLQNGISIKVKERARQYDIKYTAQRLSELYDKVAGTVV